MHEHVIMLKLLVPHPELVTIGQPNSLVQNA